LLVALAVVGTVSAVIGCGGSHHSTTARSPAADSGPTGIARAYVAARNSNDATKLCSLYVAQLRQLIGGPSGNCAAFVRRQMAAAGNAKYALRGVAEETSTAGMATITTTRHGGTAELSIPLLRVNGAWRIADIDQVSGF
jgi:hypothetical protein